jgi:hypothetical protein
MRGLGSTRWRRALNPDVYITCQGLVLTMDELDDLDQSLRDSVTGLVSALGGIDFTNPSRPYVLGDDALGCLKDLKKWVKFYGSSGKLDALRCIADTNLVSLDLCQILGQFKEGQENDKVKSRLALNCCYHLCFDISLTL